jgi:hypothetical protein
LFQVWIAALIAAAPARGVLQILPMRGPIPVAIVVLGLYGAIFFAASMALKLPEAQAMQTLLSRRLGSTPKK